MFLKKAPKLLWTHHAREKMAYYRLSEQRVCRVLNSPKRIEEGVAPKTIAAMAPASLHAVREKNIKKGSSFQKKSAGKFSAFQAVFIKASADKSASAKASAAAQTWSQEIWVMVQDVPTGRKVISAWRYPGVTKPRSELTKEILRGEYQDFMGA